jgi:hypothetical protein
MSTIKFMGKTYKTQDLQREAVELAALLAKKNSVIGASSC